MYARVTTFAVKPEYNNDDTMEQIRAIVPGRLRGLHGFREAFHLGPREDNKAIVVSFWATEEDAEAALPEIREIWSEFSHMLAAPPEPQGYEVSLHSTP